MIKYTTPLVIGNWKATPKTLQEGIALIKKIERRLSSIKRKFPKKSYFLAVPEVFIHKLSEIASHGYIGAQTIGGVVIGQITGGSTPSQVASSGAVFTLIGHSEVRKRGESVEERNKKIESALQVSLTTVLCIGEHKRDKEGKYLEELESDLRQSLANIPRESFKHLIVAYEPVWAIGATIPATPHECFEAVIGIRRALASLVGIDYAKKVNILYGGAVNKDTAKSFLEEGGVDGLLIGRASQEVSTFVDILTTLH